MHMNLMNNEHTWSGTLTVDGGWGPKSLIVETLREQELWWMRPTSELRGLEDALRPGDDKDLVSTYLENKGYELVVGVGGLGALIQALHKIQGQRPELKIHLELHEKVSEDPEPGTDVRRLILESVEGCEYPDFYLGLEYAQWTPLFNQKYPDIYYSYVEAEYGKAVY